MKKRLSVILVAAFFLIPGIFAASMLSGCQSSTGEHSHSYEWITTAEPTCDAEGTEEFVCKDCKVVSETRKLSALGHTPGEWETDSESSCLTGGKKILKCTVCGKVIEERELELAEHDCEWKVTTEPTCDTEGAEESVCKKCGEVVETKKIAALGHTPGEWKTDSESSCLTGGKEILKCTVCGKVIEERELEPAEHDCEWKVKTEPTCDTEGTEESVCKKCGAVTETKKIAALGHKAGEWKVTKEATCTEAGERSQSCERCGKVLKSESVKAKGHSYSEEKTIVKKPTCAETGLEECVCKLCGAKKQTKLPTVEHSWGEWKETRAATLTAEGEMTRTCSVCGKKETKSIEKLKYAPGTVVLSGTPKIDGKLDDAYLSSFCMWEKPMEHLGYSAAGNDAAEKYMPNTEGKMYLLHDDNWVYFCCVIHDETICSRGKDWRFAEKWPWNDDGAEIYLWFSDEDCMSIHSDAHGLRSVVDEHIWGDDHNSSRTYHDTPKENWAATIDEKNQNYTVEIRIALPDYVKTGSKIGTLLEIDDRWSVEKGSDNLVGALFQFPRFPGADNFLVPLA